MMRMTHCVAALVLVAASHVALFAAPPVVRMPVVPSDDIIEFQWKDFAFDRPKTDKVDLSLLPDNVRALQGQRIRVRGHMMPSFQQLGIRQFILQSFVQMRFGEPMPVDAVMAVSMAGETSLGYSTRPLTLEGTLTIDEWILGSQKKEAILIYRLHDAQIYGPAPQD